MKKITYLFLVLLSVPGYGQKTSGYKNRLSRYIYVKAGAGYSIPALSEPFSGTRSAHLYPNNGFKMSFDVKPSSYSAGTTGILNVGIMLSKHIAFEIGSNTGVNNRSQQYSYSASDTNSSIYYSYKVTRHAKTPVLLTGNLILHSGGKTVDLYTKAGLVAPLHTGQSREVVTSDNGTTDAKKYSYTNNYTLGINGAIGLSYNLNRRLKVWGEASMISLAPYLKKRELTASLSNGINDLSSIPDEEKRTFYGTHIANAKYYPVSNYFPPAQASYSNTGLNAGITLRLGHDHVTDELSAATAKSGRLYFKVGLGKAFATSTGNGANASVTYRNYYNPDYVTRSFNYRSSSYFAGMNGNVSAGYLINNHIGIELGATIGLVNNKSVSNNVSLNLKSTVVCYGVSTDVYYDSYRTTTTYAKTPLVMTPSLVIQTGGEKVNIYSRLGLALPINTNITQESTIDDVPNATAHVMTIKTEYSTHFTLGYSMSVGTSLNVGKHMSVWIEANTLSLSPYVKEGRLTQQMGNGVDQLKYFSEKDRITAYKFSGDSQTGQNEQETYTLPFSTMGVQAGVSFHLSSHKKELSGLRLGSGITD